MPNKNSKIAIFEKKKKGSLGILGVKTQFLPQIVITKVPVTQ